MLRTKVDEELSRGLSSGLFGNTGTQDVESMENNVQKVKLNCILLLVFWCNQLYSNDTLSIIDVLDAIQTEK